MKIGERIRNARTAAGLTQAQAAARIGQPQPRWSEIEAGGDSMTVKTLRRVADALGVQARELI